MKRLSVALALVLGLLVGPAISGLATTIDVQGVRVELRLNKDVYSQGEPVGVTLALTNLGGSAVSWQFPTGQMYDFMAMRGGQIVWQWSMGRMFIQAFTTLTLNPGEAKTFSDRWNQQDAQGHQVPSGEYEMAAVFPGGGGGLAPARTGGPRVPFRIADGSTRPQRMPSATSRPATIEGAAGGEVLVNSQVVFRIGMAAGGFSAAGRAGIVAARLQRLFAEHLPPADLTAVQIGKDAAILWRRQLIVTVDSNDAHLAKTAPLTLAEGWLHALTRAIAAAP